MAPNGHKATGRKGARQSRDTGSTSFWESQGRDVWKKWQEEDPTHDLPYLEWQNSKHVTGLPLYYATLDVLQESDSSDEDVETIKAKSQPRKVRGPSARDPKKKVATTNGNGLPRTAKSATPSAVANNEESPSAKKKRKARKKPLSEETIASASDSGEANKELETSTPVAETATPAAPAITVNGRRKSSGRKARKKPLSEETISPEDELDDPMDTTIDEVAMPAVASPLPVRSAPKSPAQAQTSEPPKKSHILKLSTRKTPKKKTTSDETVPEDEVDAKAATSTPTSTVAAVTEPDITINTDAALEANGDYNESVDSAAASPAPESVSGATTRRGLRTRRPAQQRPYYHDAQLFEDVEPTNGEAPNSTNTSPDTKSRRVSVASLSKNVDDALLAQLDEEALALLQEEPQEPSSTRPKHFKGKGRAWKKEGSDEDEEFSMAAKKKAAKAARMKAKGQVPKKRGRPRKSGRSEELVGEDDDEEGIRRKRAPVRKSALSEEFVRDSDDEVEMEVDVEVESTTPKDSPNKSYTPKGTPNKSYTPKGTPNKSYTPKGTPNKSYTPKGTPNKLYTPKGTPKGEFSLGGEGEAGTTST